MTDGIDAEADHHEPDTDWDTVHTQNRGDDTVIATVTVEAPRPVVFTAFTDPVALARWFWPQRFGTRTEVVLTHSANASTTDRDDHLQGWRDCLGRLAGAYATPGR